MKCNLKECYWNMWSPKNEMMNNDNSMVCVSEDLEEHFDTSSDFEVLLSDEKCPSYRPYISYCGKHKKD